MLIFTGRVTVFFFPVCVFFLVLVPPAEENHLMKIPNSVVLLRSWFRRSALGSRSQRDGVVTWIFFFRRRFFPWNIHPWRLTWNLKITCLKRKIIFQTSIFGFHVDFQGCTDLIVFVWKPFFFLSRGCKFIFFPGGYPDIPKMTNSTQKSHDITSWKH